MFKTVLIICFTFILLTSLSAQSVDNSLIVVDKNKQVIDTVLKYGAGISPTYQKAVCTELIIKILDKFNKLNNQDKRRIRIITNEQIPTLIKNNSPIPKGVYYALTENKMGVAIDSLHQVLPGDFVQFWTDTWGHCGIVKKIDNVNKIMDLYSSFPSTNGYGVQRFAIPSYCFFVRLK